MRNVENEREEEGEGKERQGRIDRMINLNKENKKKKNGKYQTKIKSCKWKERKGNISKSEERRKKQKREAKEQLKI